MASRPDFFESTKGLAPLLADATQGVRRRLFERDTYTWDELEALARERRSLPGDIRAIHVTQYPVSPALQLRGMDVREIHLNPTGVSYRKQDVVALAERLFAAMGDGCVVWYQSEHVLALKIEDTMRLPLMHAAKDDVRATISTFQRCAEAAGLKIAWVLWQREISNITSGLTAGIYSGTIRFYCGDIETVGPVGVHNIMHVIGAEIHPDVKCVFDCSGLLTDHGAANLPAGIIQVIVRCFLRSSYKAKATLFAHWAAKYGMQCEAVLVCGRGSGVPLMTRRAPNAH